VKTNHFAASASVFLALASVSERASAVEHQHHLGLDSGLSMLKIDDKATLSVGAGLGVHYAYGLTDQLNLMIEGSSSIVALNEDKGPGIPTTRPARIDVLGAGIGYVLDITRLVPYGGVLAAGYVLSGGSTDKPIVLGGAQLALGCDYMLTRNFAFGLAYRQHMLLTQMSTYPSYSTIFLRVEYVWGW
jgi:hypothetical protein